jgi:hypothetical protein
MLVVILPTNQLFLYHTGAYALLVEVTTLRNASGIAWMKWNIIPSGMTKNKSTPHVRVTWHLEASNDELGGRKF